MALQSSGQISLNDIHIEAGGSSGSLAGINDSDIRGLISKGSGAQMSFSEWYGASNTISITVLLVAGGGGGGSHNSGGPYGGGGAGGVLYGTMSVSPNSTHSFTIGAGGTAGNFSNGRGTANPGGNSTFNGATATGGGGGGNSGTPYYDGRGGSGGSGGASAWYGPGGSGTQGNSGGLTGYGNNGGVGGQASSVAARAGGGGAGGAGYQNGWGAGKTFNMGGTNYYVGEGGGGGSHGNGSGYGGGGGGFGTGNSGVLIVTGPNNTVVKTSSGTLTISGGTLS